ncbi:MAG: hypothetical protein NC131_04305 [Roseburia sp.]|nr:hypothetical protein [Roseburia sp.]
MNFCEGCNIACNDERCPKCGRKKLRAVNDDDFCLVAQVDRFFGDILKGNLENENIECVLMPYGTGVNSKFALPLENYLLYVRYKNLEYVREILKDENL